MFEKNNELRFITKNHFGYPFVVVILAPLKTLNIFSSIFDYIANNELNYTADFLQVFGLLLMCPCEVTSLFLMK